MFENEADAEWQAGRLAARLAALRAQRPVNLSDRGNLHHGIAEWGERLLAGQAGNLLLRGPVGAGKSWSAWEVLHRIVEAGYPGRIAFSSAADWREAIAPPVDRDRLRAMRTADVLFLDDVGSSRVGEWELEMLLGVVDERWAHARPIIATSNVENLRETVGERIASRLADRATAITLTGDDRRRAR